MVLCGVCDLHKGGVYGVGCVTYIRMVLCGGVTYIRVVMCDLHKGGVYGVGCVTYIRMVLCGGCDIRVVCMVWGVSPT